MSAAWVDKTVDDIAASGASRETAVELWKETYDDADALAEAREACGPCVEAVVDAALGSSGE